MITGALELVSQPCRLEILRLVWLAELSAGEIAKRFRVTFGAVSQHLAKLHRAGLVTRRRDGRTIYYRAKRDQLGPLAPALEALWAQQLGALKVLAEEEQRRVDGARGAGATGNSKVKE